MKKSIMILLIVPLLMGCELGSLTPESKLIGTWKFLSIRGSYTYIGKTFQVNQVGNNRILIFEKKGACDCDGYDTYKVSGTTITFTDSGSKKSVEYTYSIVKDVLALFQNLQQFRNSQSDPQNYTAVDLASSWEKQ